MSQDSLKKVLTDEVVEKESLTIRLPKSLIAQVKELRLSLGKTKFKVSKSKLYEVLLKEGITHYKL